MKQHPDLTHIAKAVAALDDGSLSNSSQLDQAAKRLAYTCLRVIILGNRGLDVVGFGPGLSKELTHHSRKRVNERLRCEIRELKSAMRQYPNEKDL